MFGVSGGELIILLVIGLVVLGPERLPRVANQIGSWLGQARRMTRVMKRQLEEELDLDEVTKIKPPPPKSREPSTKADYVPPRDDDDFSPQHSPDEVGTGVGEDIYASEEDLAVIEADRGVVGAISDDPPVHVEGDVADPAEEKTAT